MTHFNPVLTDILQVFSLERLIQLEKNRGFTNSFAFNWGQDCEVSLAARYTDVKKQWNGTCTSFATIGAIENKLGGQVALSERSLWRLLWRP